MNHWQKVVSTPVILTGLLKGGDCVTLKVSFSLHSTLTTRLIFLLAGCQYRLKSQLLINSVLQMIRHSCLQKHQGQYLDQQKSRPTMPHIFHDQIRYKLEIFHATVIFLLKEEELIDLTCKITYTFSSLHILNRYSTFKVLGNISHCNC